MDIVRDDKGEVADATAGHESGNLGCLQGVMPRCKFSMTRIRTLHRV